MKNTMKLFALCATVLAFSAALASCQKEKATPEVPEMHVFHVELDATVADTKATYTTASKKITFESGDALYIVLAAPTSAAWSGAAGTLTYDGTSFKGDIAYTGTYEGSDIITDAKALTATFLPKGYGSVNYLSATGVATATKAFYAGAKSAAVPQLVHLTATLSDKAGETKSPLTLSAQNSVLCYTIAANSLSASTHFVSVSNGNGITISGIVSAVADQPTTFAVAFPADATERTYTLSTIGYNDVTKGGKALVAGKVVNISTTAAESNAPLPGVFTVDNSNKKVKFSKGNLQATYNGSAWSWAFAANQWDYIGNAEGNTKVTATSPFVSDYTGTSTTVDLFGWVGASSNWTDVNQYGITSSTAINSKDGYGNVINESLKEDWGTLIGTGWRTLTSAEWTYLLDTRAGTRYCRARVNSVSGLVIFPDSYSHPSGPAAVANANTVNSDYNSNTWSGEGWTKMETAGAVFLPAAGYRSGTSFSDVGSNGNYWSSTPDSFNVSDAYRMYFRSGLVRPASNNPRSHGYSVRLVQNQ